MRETKPAIIILCLILFLAEGAFAANDPRKFDEYTGISCEEELARLDSFASSLRSEPATRGYVFVYPTRSGKPGEARERALYVREYLIGRGVNSERLKTLNGGFRQGLTVELWLQAPGERQPAVTHLFHPLDVRLVVGNMKKFNYLKYRRHRCGRM